MAFATGMKSAPKNPGRSEYILEGNHIFQINALKEIDGHQGEGFVAEMEVADSDNSEMRIGSMRGWIRLKKTNPKGAQADVREFLSILADCDQDDIDDDSFPALVSEDQPLAGHYIGCYAFVKPTKTGGQFTHTRWRHIGPELGDESIANSIK